MTTITHLRRLMESYNFAAKHADETRVHRDRLREQDYAANVNAEILYDAATERRDDLRHDLERAMRAALPAMLDALTFVQELADDGCRYGDNCPSNARHGKCLPCSARERLAALGGEGDQ